MDAAASEKTLLQAAVLFLAPTQPHFFFSAPVDLAELIEHGNGSMGCPCHAAMLPAFLPGRAVGLLLSHGHFEPKNFLCSKKKRARE
jgi:hypothetical protein